MLHKLNGAMAEIGPLAYREYNVGDEKEGAYCHARAFMVALVVAQLPRKKYASHATMCR